MMKRVISIRLSDQQVALLDQACRRLNVNRSEAIGASIGLLERYYSEGGKLTDRYEFDLQPLVGEPNDEA